MKTQKSFYEQNGGTYTQVGDVLIPNLTIAEAEPLSIGKYGRMRKRYLKEHRPVLYTNLLVTGKLDQHLAEIDMACEGQVELLINQMAKQEGVTETLKATDQMAWVAHMNSMKIGTWNLRLLNKNESARLRLYSSVRRSHPGYLEAAARRLRSRTPPSPGSAGIFL